MEFGEIKRSIWDGQFKEALVLIEKTHFSNPVDKSILLSLFYECQGDLVKKYEFINKLQSQITDEIPKYYRLKYLLAKSYVTQDQIADSEVQEIVTLYPMLSEKLE